MANRIIVATLYQSTYNNGGLNQTAYLLNVSPRTLETHTPSDNIFLTVNLDSTVANLGATVNCEVGWKIGDCPFEQLTSPPPTVPFTPATINTPTLMGTLSPVSEPTEIEFTLSITYYGNTYTEDPKMQINA
jgi:hypothetical protein